jgi:uncharacterized protein YxeA
MKQTLLIACAVVLLAGCNKILDYYNLDEHGKPHVKPIPHCKLMSETNTEDPVYQRTLYEYDEEGKPTHISFPYPDEGHYIDVEYDEQGRLAYEHVSTYVGPGNRKYVYEGDSRLPVRDTLYRWYDLVYTESFTYDNSGRIIREEARFVSAPDDYEEVFGDPRVWEMTSVYYYDLRGNRQYRPRGNQGTTRPVPYSDKPNLYLLHPVFQLYFRDFSRNSTVYDDKNVATYNDSGLPLTFRDSHYVNVYDCAE